MPKFNHLRPSGLHHNPAYSHVVVAQGARTIYISGQVSTDEEGRVVGPGDIAAQTTQVMTNLGLALKSAGAAHIYLAGRPGELEDALRQAGVQEFIYVGCDVLATLRTAHDTLGLKG